jgi:predicted phage terminase large subunit-like protein
MSNWDVVYRKAYNEDGSLFFPEKLSAEVLEEKKRTLGSYIFANQYLNEIIPSDRQTFKKEWFKYYQSLPKRLHTFIVIDPALSEADTSDSTGVTVVSVDSRKDWYVRAAKKMKLTPTQIVDFCFRIYDQFKPELIGIEEVAYQKALLYFLDEEMRRRNKLLPIKGIKPPTDKSKQMRILSLVPRFEWGHIFLSQGLTDLETELLQFPRGAHDDVIDALAYTELIAYPPDEEKAWETPPSPGHKDYEKYYIWSLQNNKTRKGVNDGEE